MPVTCQYLLAQRSTQLFSPTFRSASLYLRGPGTLSAEWPSFGTHGPLAATCYRSRGEANSATQTVRSRPRGPAAGRQEPPLVHALLEAGRNHPVTTNLVSPRLHEMEVLRRLDTSCKVSPVVQIHLILHLLLCNLDSLRYLLLARRRRHGGSHKRADPVLGSGGVVHFAERLSLLFHPGCIKRVYGIPEEVPKTPKTSSVS